MKRDPLVRDVSMNLPLSLWPFRNFKGMLLLSTVSKATTIFPFILKNKKQQKENWCVKIGLSWCPPIFVFFSRV